MSYADFGMREASGSVRPSRVLSRWREGQACLGVALHLTDASVFEVTSAMGFDVIWMDLEHHAYSLQTAEALMRASRVGRSDVMARPAKGEFMRLGRLLEAGASGIMYPRCDDEAEASQVVRWSRFPPLGERGLGFSGPDSCYGRVSLDDYLRQANEQTFLAIQIEDAAAVQRAEAIAAVPGVDLLFFGPGDFSMLTGVAGQVRHPTVERAVRAVAKAAANTGKRWGTVAFDPDHARLLLSWGASLVVPVSDIGLLIASLDRVREQYASLGVRFCEPGTSTDPASPNAPC